MRDACLAFDTPVTGGNVSFYNESPTGAIDPTPTVGMVGLLERVADRVPSHFMTPGDEEQWTVSVQHTEADVQKYVDAFGEFCQELAG